MRVRGYYGTVYEIPDDDPFPAIDKHLSDIGKNFSNLTFEHPDLDKLLDLRSQLKRNLAPHED